MELSSSCFILLCKRLISIKLLLQVNLEKTSTALHDLQENYSQVVSTLKEKEFTISKLLKSGEFFVSHSNITLMLSLSKPKIFSLCMICLSL